MKYIDIRKYLREGIYFNFFIGGRGIGKTYSTDKMLIKDEKEFLRLRTTSTELDMSCDSNEVGKSDKNVVCKRINKNMWGVYKKDKYIGSCCALSIFKNLRGVNFEDVEIIFQDEFIPEVNARKIIKDESTAWFNMIETVNRNRELQGKKPVLYIGCANANEIYNPYFVELGLIDKLEECLNTGKQKYIDEERSLQVVILEPSEEFVRAKSQTALYKLAKGTKFEQMSLNNQFAFNDFTMVKQMNTKGYQAFVQYDDMILYKKKNSDLLVVKKNRGDRLKVYFDLNDEVEKDMFIYRFKEMFYESFLKKSIYFESYELKRKTFDIFKIKC